MSSSKPLVTIKGIKEGLLFILDDTAPFPAVIADLTHKLEHTHGQFLDGPIVHVFVRMGKRPLSEPMKEKIEHIFASRGNLLIRSITTDVDKVEQPLGQFPFMKSVVGIVRSGQTLQADSDILFIGDVNPGGTITSPGHIFVLGSLRGLAHAGISGNEQAVIGASYLRPTQLRIAGVVSRPPDEWGFDEAVMEFAYLRDGVMEIERMNQLYRVRPQLATSKKE